MTMDHTHNIKEFSKPVTQDRHGEIWEKTVSCSICGKVFSRNRFRRNNERAATPIRKILIR